MLEQKCPKFSIWNKILPSGSVESLPYVDLIDKIIIGNLSIREVD